MGKLTQQEQTDHIIWVSNYTGKLTDHLLKLGYPSQSYTDVVVFMAAYLGKIREGKL